MFLHHGYSMRYFDNQPFLQVPCFPDYEPEIPNTSLRISLGLYIIFISKPRPHSDTQTLDSLSSCMR